MTVFDIKYIEFHWFWTIVQRFSSIFEQKTRQYNVFYRFPSILNDSTTIFIDFGRGDQIVHIFEKTPSWKKYKKYAARAARAASAIGVHRIFRSDVFAWRFFDFLRDVRNGMIGFWSKIRHRGGTRKINGSGRGAGSAIGVHRICKSNVFAWRFFDFFGDVRNGMIGFWKTCYRLTFFRLFWGRPQRNERNFNEFWKIHEEKKSAGQAASAIRAHRIFKSSVIAWRFFDFFRTATNGMQILGGGGASPRARGASIPQIGGRRSIYT